ncbi:MAG: 2-amino-4-hydroxy-6-hydroxymethyldihydropteridine diphosphokinase [Chloroflexota bacterium]
MAAQRVAYLALGSNVGDRLANLRQAVDLLSSTTGLSVLRAAGVYETEPVGVRDQPWFLNTVVELSTGLSPQELLAAVKGVERSVGRTPTYRWGPREIDVDILLYEGAAVSSDELTIPHPRMRERLFVLLPLRDLCPEWRDAEGAGIDELIERNRGTAEVRPYPERILLTLRGPSG